jgi:hypothetical protein
MYSQFPRKRLKSNFVFFLPTKNVAYENSTIFVCS